MDYRAAMFMMGLTELTPVVVLPPEKCTAASVPESDIGDGKLCEITGCMTEASTVPCLKSQSSESVISSLKSEIYSDNGDEIKYSSGLDGDADDVTKEEELPLESNSSVSIISSLHIEHEANSHTNPVKPQFPTVVCFLCHEAVEKSMKGVMYAYCGLSSDLVNCSSMKISHFVPEHLSDPFEKCVMLLNEHQKMSRYPNFQIPPCAPAIVYTGAIATEVLIATKELFNKLMSVRKLLNS